MESSLQSIPTTTASLVSRIDGLDSTAQRTCTSLTSSCSSASASRSICDFLSTFVKSTSPHQLPPSMPQQVNTHTTSTPHSVPP